MSKFITNLSASTALTGAELLETAQLSLVVRISAATISAAAADNSYNDSANGFVAAGFAVGDRVNVAGFVASVVNNILVGTITALTTGKMTIGGTDGDVIVDNIAGDTVVITKWLSARAKPDDIVGRAAFAMLASKITPAALAANTNDYAPANLATSSRLRISASAAVDLTGIAAPATDGRILIIANVGGNTITLKDEGAGSTAANRFALTADIPLVADATVMLYYDTTASRWRVVGGASGSGGGSSGGNVILSPYPSSGIDPGSSSSVATSPAMLMVGAYVGASTVVNGIYLPCRSVAGRICVPALYDAGVITAGAPPTPTGAALVATGPSVAMVDNKVLYMPFAAPFTTVANHYYFLAVIYSGAGGNITTMPLGSARRGWYNLSGVTAAPNPAPAMSNHLTDFYSFWND